jgi:hypothetical protein
MIIVALQHQELLMQQYSIVSNNHLALETSRAVDAAVQHCVPMDLNISATNPSLKFPNIFY